MDTLILIITHAVAVLIGAVIGGMNKSTNYVDQLQDAYDEGYRKGSVDAMMSDIDDCK